MKTKEGEELRVIVIDDISTVRRVLKKLLKDIGVTNVEEAPDGEAGFEMISKGDFNLIICDWNMPKLMGIHLADRLRADTRLASIPFIMVTANNTSDHVTQAASRGIRHYLGKPFSADKLGAMIQEALGISAQPSGDSQGSDLA